MPTAKTYTVSVVCQGVALTDDVLERLFSRLGDVVPAERDGALFITAPVENAPDDLAAAMFLVAEIQQALPQAIVLRMDQDLVSVSDIAGRTGRSRESVRLLVDGKRGPGGFPPPVGAVGDGIRIWPWATVLTWFRDVLGENLDEEGVAPETAATVDAYLARERSTNSAGASELMLQYADQLSRPTEPGALAPWSKLARLWRSEKTSGESSDASADVLGRLVRDAVSKNARVIHLEPRGDHYQVRVRASGKLADASRLWPGSAAALIEHVKKQAGIGLDASLPEQATFTVPFSGRDMQVDVAIARTVKGEKVVLTLQPSQTLSRAKTGLDYSPVGAAEQEEVKQPVRR